MIDAEHNVLGGVLMDPSTLDTVAAILDPSDFINPLHRDLFQACNELAASNEGVDVFTVSQWIEKHTKHQNQVHYLGTIQKNTPSTKNIEHYARAVKEESLNRQLKQIVGDAFQQCDQRGDFWQRLDDVQSKILKLSEKKQTKKRQTIRDILRRVVDAIDAKFNRGGEISGTQTGYTDLDEMLDGLHDGDLIIVAGRPSMGKTTLAMNIAEHIASDETVLVFSLEMSGEQLVERLLSAKAKVGFQKIRSGKLNDDDWPKLTAGVGKAVESKLVIEDGSGLTINELRSRARQVKREQGLGLVVIDYLQLMEGQGENRNQVIGEISRGIKSLARELQVPIIALSQLNRGVDSRSTKRPVMSDLRESGAIEQDADVILFVYRDEVYNEKTTHKGIAEIIIGKQRNGPLGTVYLTFQGHFCRFENFIGALPTEPERTPGKWNSGFEYN